MSDHCGVRWGTHSCRYGNDGHLVGVDCECHCADEDGPGYPNYPYGAPLHPPDFTEHTLAFLADAAQRNFEHAIRFGPA